MHGMKNLKFRQCTFKLKTEARSCCLCCSGKSVRVTYPECVFVALSIQHVMGMRLIVICGWLGSSIFFPLYLTNSKIFEKKKLLKARVLIFFTTFVCNISLSF